MTRSTLFLAIKFGLLLVWYFFSAAVAAHVAANYIGLPPQEQSTDLMQRVFLVACLEVATLCWLVSNLHTSLVRTTLIVFCFYHVTKHALMLLEALFYLNLWNKPALLSINEIIGLEIMGLISSAALCVAVVLVFGQHRRGQTPRHSSFTPSWRFLLTGGVSYTLCYCLAGALILIPLAAQSYSQSYENLAVPIWMPILQLGRGMVWSLLIGICLASFLKQNLAYSSVLISTCLVVFSTAQLLIPNSMMPDQLQAAHIIELVVSMSIFGALTTWVWLRTQTKLQGQNRPV